MVAFGTETSTDVSSDGSVKTSVRVEKHNDTETRRLLITEESIRIEDKKTILDKVLQAFALHERGELIGWGVDASIYEPKTLKTTRIVVKTIKLQPKTQG